MCRMNWVRGTSVYHKGRGFSSQTPPVIHQHSSNLVHSTLLPACDDGTECSETWAYKLQTLGNYPKESTQRYNFLSQIFSHVCLNQSRHIPVLSAATSQQIVSWLRQSVTCHSLHKSGFNPRLVHVGFVKGGSGTGVFFFFFCVFRVSTVSITSPILNTHISFIYHQHYIISAINRIVI
jgi:hypothetical protein